MPSSTRTRVSAPTEVVGDAEDHDMGGDLPSLSFDQTLSWRAGKPIAVKELLQRLETLSTELRGIEQDEVDKTSLVPTAKELVNQQLMSHKDRGVRAWTGSCLVDILRISAPDAPYTAKELKDIFNLFVLSTIPALADPSHPYNSQHLYILKSLAEVKSIVLLTDIPASATLIHTLFVNCFDVLSGPSKADSGEELSKNVEHHMTAVLATLVDEAQSLPSDVIDTILAQFLRADPRFAANGAAKGKKAVPVDNKQGTLLLKEAPPAYNMAKNMCNSCPEKMARYVTRYFSAVISEAPTMSNDSDISKRKSRRKATDADDSDDDVANGDADEDWKEIIKAHSLMRELWRSTPAVLQDIIPSMEGELQSGNAQLRLLAVETIGDMISGIGIGGLPPPPVMNPSAWPSQSLEPPERSQVYNFMTTPTSPVSFISRYPHVYAAFLKRKDDPVSTIRSAWATAIGRVVTTSAGGVGLDSEAENKLLIKFADCFRDIDERVRLSSVKAVGQFDFDTVVLKLGANGGVNDQNSVLSNLAEIAKDRKPLVHTEVIQLLARIWGVAAGAISNGNERITASLGPIPSKIFDAYYVNLPEITALADRTLYESLLPLGYPPIKPKTAGRSQSQRVKDSQANEAELDPDKIRTERILTFVRGLDQRAKPVFFSRASQQTSMAKYMTLFLDICEQYNGGVIDSNEKEVKSKLNAIIELFIARLPEPSKSREDLWKFAKAHDRRNYQLIRFCMDPASDYRKIQKAIKELTKRLEEASGTGSTLILTLHTLIYRSSLLIYNRSHVPAIIEFSRSDEKGLASTAHELLKEISKNKSEVFKSHIQELCRSLESEAPTAKRPEAAGAVQDLKACAQYASKFPDDVPKDRKFLQALLGFIAHGKHPKAAKHAVYIILTVTERAQVYAKEIFKICTADFEYGKGNFLAKLAGLSQLVLLGYTHLEGSDADSIVEIAISKVLKNPEANPVVDDGDTGTDWTTEPDEHCEAKGWALKILVNALRARDETAVVDQASQPVFAFLESTVSKRGQLSKKRAPQAHDTRLCLLASTLMLKLCCEQRFNSLFSPRAFNNLATVVQDPCLPVREGFVKKLMKYLGQQKLTNRFYTYLFLLAFEPDQPLKDSTLTWLRSRAAAYARSKEIVLELVFARLLSVLAHHPDLLSVPKGDEQYSASLKDFARYVVFYLQAVAMPDNLSLIYHIAQRVKGVRDGVGPEAKEGSPDYSENLYILSDLSQAAIRAFQDAKGWSLPAWPKKVAMPSGIFKVMPSHEVAQEIAMKRYLPDDLAEDGLDDVVKSMLRTSKKRKTDASGDGTETGRKKARGSVSGPAGSKTKKEGKTQKKREVKTPKKKSSKGKDYDGDTNAPSSDRRRSSRHTATKTYAEATSDEEDEIMADEDQPEESEEASSEAELSEAEHADSPEPVSARARSTTNSVRSKRQASSGVKSKSNGVSKKSPVGKTPTRSTRNTRAAPKKSDKAEVVDISSEKSSDLSDMSDDE